MDKIVAMILPKPFWSHGYIESLESHCKTLTSDIDIIKTRKSLNKDEDAYVQSFVNYTMNKIDSHIKSHMDSELASTKQLVQDMRQLVSLEIRISKKEKKEIEDLLYSKPVHLEIALYVYESGLTHLNEMILLSDLWRSSTMKEISTREINKYVMRIAERARMETLSALQTYMAQSSLDMKVSEIIFEPLGKLMEFRKKTRGKIVKASEGDYYRNRYTKEAYDEDSLNDYTFDEMFKNFTRQRTVKLTTKVSINARMSPVAKELLDQIQLLD